MAAVRREGARQRNRMWFEAAGGGGWDILDCEFHFREARIAANEFAGITGNQMRELFPRAASPRQERRQERTAHTPAVSIAPTASTAGG